MYIYIYIYICDPLQNMSFLAFADVCDSKTLKSTFMTHNMYTAATHYGIAVSSQFQLPRLHVGFQSLCYFCRGRKRA